VPMPTARCAGRSWSETVGDVSTAGRFPGSRSITFSVGAAKAEILKRISSAFARSATEPCMRDCNSHSGAVIQPRGRGAWFRRRFLRIGIDDARCSSRTPSRRFAITAARDARLSHLKATLCPSPRLLTLYELFIRTLRAPLSNRNCRGSPGGRQDDFNPCLTGLPGADILAGLSSIDGLPAAA